MIRMEKNWHGKVNIVREGITPGHYFALGKQCLTDYYKRFHPFNQGKTLASKTYRDELKDGDKHVSVQGYIDRLAWSRKRNLRNPRL